MKNSLQQDPAVQAYITSLPDEQTVQDAQTLLSMMHTISGSEPKLWNAGTIGFDTYHYKYSSGREGDSFVVGFYPRKGKITVYLMDGTTRHATLLAQLGKHTTTGYCIYIKQLSDVDISVLEQIIKQSYGHIKSLKQPISEILWKSNI